MNTKGAGNHGICLTLLLAIEVLCQTLASFHLLLVGPPTSFIYSATQRFEARTSQTLTNSMNWLSQAWKKTITLDSGLQFQNISQLLCLRHIMQSLGRACGSIRPSSPATNWHLMKSHKCCSVECCFAANFKNSFSSSAKADCFWYLSDSLIGQRHSNSNPHELPSANFFGYPQTPVLRRLPCYPSREINRRTSSKSRMPCNSQKCLMQAHCRAGNSIEHVPCPETSLVFRRGLRPPAHWRTPQ